MVPLKSLWKIGMLSGILINQHSKEPQIKPWLPKQGVGKKVAAKEIPNDQSTVKKKNQVPRIAAQEKKVLQGQTAKLLEVFWELS